MTMRSTTIPPALAAEPEFRPLIARREELHRRESAAFSAVEAASEAHQAAEREWEAEARPALLAGTPTPPRPVFDAPFFDSEAFRQAHDALTAEEERLLRELAPVLAERVAARLQPLDARADELAAQLRAVQDQRAALQRVGEQLGKLVPSAEEVPWRVPGMDAITQRKADAEYAAHVARVEREFAPATHRERGPRARRYG